MTADELRQRIGKNESTIVELKALEKQAGWKHMQVQLEAQVRASRYRVTSQTVNSMNGAFRLAHEQGYLAGLSLAMILHQSLLEDAQANIEALRDEIKNIEEDEENGT